MIPGIVYSWSWTISLDELEMYQFFAILSVCKYKFVLMNNEYNLYFNSFTKKYSLILSSLNLTRTRDFLDFCWKMD